MAHDFTAVKVLSRWLILLAFAGLAVGSIAAALLAGSVDLVWQDLFVADRTQSNAILFQLRLPRALTAFGCGALLALSGALMQVLLRNPLADPYILGVSGGGAVAALGATMLSLASWWIPVGAFIGASLSTLLVFLLAHRQGVWSAERLLLTGVTLASGWGAAISFMLSIAPDRDLRGMIFWLMGDLSHGDSPTLACGAALVGLIVARLHARELNLLGRGEAAAASLGVETRRLRNIIFILGAGMTAIAVSVGGAIGFVGLVIPHAVRMVIGSDHRWLLPVSALAGGALLVLADTVARTAAAPQQLPVGVITALIGVPLFLFLLQRSYRRAC